jgi:hypothetical protein
MKWCKLINIIAGILLAALSGMAYANDSEGNIDLPTAASFYTHNSQPLKSLSFNSPAYLLAANDADVIQGQADITLPATEFHPPWISGRKIHQYFGLGTVVLAGLTVLAAPGEGCENCSSTTQQPRQTSATAHTRLARATAAMAIATVMSGLVVHWNDIHWEDSFFDPDKMHARVAAAGALLMLYAVNTSAHSSVPVSHSGIAELGAAAMVVAIKMTW